MQIPILSGIYTDGEPDFRIAYPVNLTPAVLPNGISAGYLKPSEGVVQVSTGSGIDRGGIEWNGAHYRVMGSKLVSVSSTGVITELGDVGNDNKLVTLDYSFDRLAIASNQNLFYWDGSTLTQVTDPDLGVVLDVVWVDGYFMTTDGEFLVVTDLLDPTSVNPLKYGSSEADPDPIVSIMKVKNEVYALNKHTIEVFDNVGGSLFPFQRIEGAQVQKGCVGTHACCEFLDTIAYIGSARNEQVSVYAIQGSTPIRISTSEVDKLLSELTDDQLSGVLVEARKDKDSERLYVHLPDRTLVYDSKTSEALGSSAWHILTSSETGFSQYRARNFVWVHNKHYAGDPQSSKLGYLDDTVSSHWGDRVRWEMSTPIIYNEGNGAVIHSLELVSLTGRVAAGASPEISTSYSYDGLSFSTPSTISAGTDGQYNKRLMWRRQGKMRNWRIQRFTSNSDAHITISALEARLEPLMF
jgi:hypothetical protein